MPNGKPLPVVLLANKCDIEGVEIDADELNRFCTEHGFITWFETSAKVRREPPTERLAHFTSATPCQPHASDTSITPDGPQNRRGGALPGGERLESRGYFCSKTERPTRPSGKRRERGSGGGSPVPGRRVLLRRSAPRLCILNTNFVRDGDLRWLFLFAPGRLATPTAARYVPRNVA